MGGQFGWHPCVATGAVPQGPSGQETTPAEYAHSKYRQSRVNLVPEADGFNFLGGRGCAEIRAKPLLGLFLSPVLVAL